MKDSRCLPNLSPGALQQERHSWFYLARSADYAGSARCFAGCDGDKTKKAVTSLRDGLLRRLGCCRLLEAMAYHVVSY